MAKRDPRDPEGQYEQEDAWGSEAIPWTDQDYINHVMGRMKSKKTINELVREEIEKRITEAAKNHEGPLEHDTYEDNLQEAIEECADMLFYLVCARENRVLNTVVEWDYELSNGTTVYRKMTVGEMQNTIADMDNKNLNLYAEIMFGKSNALK